MKARDTHPQLVCQILDSQRLAANDEEAIAAATDLAGDMFLGYSTWKWADVHSRTGGRPVYRYLYAHPRPPMRPEMGDAVGGLAGGVLRGEEAEAQRQPVARGAVHSADIEYFMGNLATNSVYAWQEFAAREDSYSPYDGAPRSRSTSRIGGPPNCQRSISQPQPRAPGSCRGYQRAPRAS